MIDVGLRRWGGVPVETWRETWGVASVEIHARIGSTNDRARELAASGAPPYSVVIADEQTSGRGRRGAAWHSSAGCGLWMSVLLPTVVDIGDLPLPLVVGVAAAEAIESVAPNVHASIKWPNDLLIGPRKVGGILCEAGSGCVVAGIGINMRVPPGGFPEKLEGRAGALEHEAGKILLRSQLCGLILGSLETMTATAEGVYASLSNFRGRDALQGNPVDTEQEGPGVARGVDDSGSLMLERADGSRVRVISGSVRLT